MRSDNSQITLDLPTDGPAAADPANPHVIAALEEYLRLCEDGAAPDPQTFIARYPDIRDTLSGALAGLRFMQDAAPHVEASSEGIARSFELNLSDLQPLGDFRIVREIGRGGMGIVYEAEQMSLARRVALKVLPFAAVLDPRHLQRFKNEALAAASLDHPNIVEVYAVGCERGVHFYAMRYVEGQTLAAVIEAMRVQGSGFGVQDDSVGNAVSGVPALPHNDALSCATAGLSSSADPPLNPEPRTLNPSGMDTSPIAALSTLRTEKPRDFFRLVAELGIQAAEALDHAHQLGIVHRDIKPSNLMIECSAQCSHLAPRDGASRSHYAERDDYTGLNPEPRTLNPAKLWITDFGLARIESDATLTLTGDLLGTLRYMSPEQAEGRSAILDHRTDIYSLGITLYELLTLKPAFPASDRQTLLRQIANDEPPPPRKLNPAIPADLETILLKATAKDPRDRNHSARDLADDLRRFLDAKPIRARRTTRFQRVRYWARRNPGVAVLTSVVFALLAVTAVAGSLAALHMARLAKSESDLRADTFLRLYASDMNRAKESLERGDITTALLLLERYKNSGLGPDPRGFEWYFLWQQCQPLLAAKQLPHELMAYGADFSPTSPSGDLLVTSQWRPSIYLWDSRTGDRIRTFNGHGGIVLDVEFTPDGTRIVSVSGDATARVWDVVKGSEVKRLTLKPCEVRAVSIAPNVPLAALGVNGSFVSLPSREPARVLIWNYETGEVVQELPGLLGRVEEVAFSPDGKLLVAGCHDDKLRRWDTSTWEELPPIPAHAHGTLALAFSTDGAILATSSGLRTERYVAGEIKLWRTADWKLLGTIASHRAAVRAVKFVRSTSTLITAANDGELAFWDVADPAQPRLLKRFLAHSQGIFDLAVSPNGQLLTSTGNDNVARLWNIAALLAEPDPVVHLGGHVGEVADFAFDRDGSAVWASATGGGATLWEIATGRDLGNISADVVGPSFIAACDKDHLLILGGSNAQTDPPVERAYCYDTRTRQQLWSVSATKNPLVHIDISPVRRADGVRLAVIPSPSDLLVLDALTGREIKRLPMGVVSRFSRDGSMLAVGVSSDDVHVFDTTTWATLTKVPNDGLYTSGLAISPDGRHLATGGSENLVKIWDIATRELVTTCAGHDDDIFTLDYSPDGKRIVSAGKDGSVRLWDPATGECVLRLSEPQGWVPRVRFSSPDGRQIAGASLDRYVHVWRLVSTPEQLNQGPTLDRKLIAAPPPGDVPQTWQLITVTEADWQILYYRWEPAEQPSQSWKDIEKSRPIYQQRAGAIDFLWGRDPPADKVPRDFFALEATSTIELAAGEYTLTTMADDGVRLYFDGKRVIDDWARHAPTKNTAEVLATAGKHHIRIEYFEHMGPAMLQFGILPAKQ